MYRIRLILVGQQPSVAGESVLPLQTIEGTWSKPGPIALMGQKGVVSLAGRRAGTIQLIGITPVQRQVN